MTRLFSFYNFIIRPEFLLKYNIKNTFCIPKLKSLEFYIFLSNLKSEEDFDLIKSFHIIEFFCLQKPYIKKFFIGTKQGKKSVSFLLKCTLRKRNMYNFIDYFVNLALPFYKSRHLKLKLNFDKNNNICFSLKDMNVFFKLPNSFLSFSKGFFFILRISKEEKRKKVLRNFLKHFNFFIRN